MSEQTSKNPNIIDKIEVYNYNMKQREENNVTLINLIKESPFKNLVNEGFNEVLYKNGVLHIQEKWFHDGTGEIKTYVMEHLVFLLKDTNYLFDYRFGLVEEHTGSSPLQLEGELLDLITANFTMVFTSERAIMADVMESSILPSLPTKTTAQLIKEVVAFTDRMKFKFRCYIDRKHNNSVVFEDNTAIVRLMPKIDAIHVKIK